MLKAINGWIAICEYCGEQVGNTQKYCSNCKKKDGRKEIFDANVKIFKKNAELGYIVPTLRNWQ